MASKRSTWIGALAALLMTVFIGPVYGATITVTTTNDELEDGIGNGLCSLREAIQAVNTSTAVGGCPAGDLSGAIDDIIELDAETYAFTITGVGENANATGDLDILSDVTIRGAGALVTIIDGNNYDRVLHTQAVVSIEAVTIQNGTAHMPGEDGGGILAQDDIVISNCRIQNNRVGGGAGGGYGGGISFEGVSLTINDSTIRDNTADIGGGVDTVAIGSISGTTFTGNSAVAGGGLSVRYVGGPGKSLEITNTTFSDNSTTEGTQQGGGIGFQSSDTDPDSTLEISHSTLVDNKGGAVLSDGNTAVVFFRGSIVSANLTQDGLDDLDCAVLSEGQVVSNDYNLVGADAGCPADELEDQTLDPSTVFTVVLEAELADNGGPTQTHALLLGSNPAVDTGTCTDIDLAPVTVDQRGEPRPGPWSSLCDVGAFELQTDPIEEDAGPGGDAGPGDDAGSGEEDAGPDGGYWGDGGSDPVGTVTCHCQTVGGPPGGNGVGLPLGVVVLLITMVGLMRRFSRKTT